MSKLWSISERNTDAESILMQKQLKTTSEWPQSGPVIPLPSNEAGISKHSFHIQ